MKFMNKFKKILANKLYNSSQNRWLKKFKKKNPIKLDRESMQEGLLLIQKFYKYLI